MACSITYQHQDASVETFKERTDVKANLRCYYIKIKAKNSMETRIAVIGQTPPSEEQIRLILHPKEITIAGGDNLGYSIENKQKFGYCLGYGDSEWYKDLVGDITGKGAVKLEDSSRVYQSTPGDRCGVLAVALAYVDSVVVVGHSIEDGFSIKDTERLKIQKIQAFCWGGVITLVTSAEECHMSVDRSIFRGRVFIKEHGVSYFNSILAEEYEYVSSVISHKHCYYDSVKETLHEFSVNTEVDTECSKLCQEKYCQCDFKRLREGIPETCVYEAWCRDDEARENQCRKTLQWGREVVFNRFGRVMSKVKEFECRACRVAKRESPEEFKFECPLPKISRRCFGLETIGRIDRRLESANKTEAKILPSVNWPSLGL